MAYIKTVWAVDTEITSSLLNHMEEQYAEAVSIIGTHDHDSDYYRKSETDQKYYHANNMGAGSGADADTLRGNAPAYFEGIGAPAGFICMFGAGAIPSGWLLCDGSEGTPDMRDRFLVGAGSTYAVNATGGAASVTPAAATFTIGEHALTVDQMPTHRHAWKDNHAGTGSYYASTTYNLYGAPYLHGPFQTGYAGEAAPQAHGHPGSTWTGDAQENRPPYFALRFIMKE